MSKHARVRSDEEKVGDFSLYKEDADRWINPENDELLRTAALARAEQKISNAMNKRNHLENIYSFHNWACFVIKMNCSRGGYNKPDLGASDLERDAAAVYSQAVQKSDQTIVMKPGRYSLTDLPEGSRDVPCSGSNNTIDLSGVHMDVPVGRGWNQSVHDKRQCIKHRYLFLFFAASS